MTSYASTLLGAHDTNIKCMHQSRCTAAIQLQRFFPNKLMDLWERKLPAWTDGRVPVLQVGVIENTEETFFRCENTDGCGVVGLSDQSSLSSGSVNGPGYC
jgi:TRIAD3 protein (E3 ubiquitin-protein ligase RNF216)